MSFPTFFQTTKFLILNLLTLFGRTPTTEERVAVLEKMMDGKLYVENVRAFFNIPIENARFLCERGVREGIFNRRVGVLCKNADCRRVLTDAESATALPGQVSCKNCEDMDEAAYRFESKKLDEVTFYVLAGA